MKTKILLVAVVVSVGVGFTNDSHRRFDTYARDMVQHVVSIRPANNGTKAILPFKIVELWRFDEPLQRWVRVERGVEDISVEPARAPLTNIPGLAVDITPVMREQSFGLFYLKWELAGTPNATLVYVGELEPEDFEIGPPPQGMIVAPIPRADSAVAGFVPDPAIHCRSEATTRPGQVDIEDSHQ
jgi:hypothetical protein